MGITREREKQAAEVMMQMPYVQETPRMTGVAPSIEGLPKVIIQGDVRLRVSESLAARRPVEGHYRLETEGMQQPLHAIWIIEGNVLDHTAHSITVAFDMRGTSAGETRTHLLTAQVTDKNGRGYVVHSSIFIQIAVAKDES
ncbi:MAG TPA: hypothetical protein VJO32_17100 [Ktedonobacteraceae bacterium]|nr:hypothetical protein [Ktedonobacteraceae bacterium]